MYFLLLLLFQLFAAANCTAGKVGGMADSVLACYDHIRVQPTDLNVQNVQDALARPTAIN